MQTNVLSEQKQRDSYLPYCTLNWRQRQLLVRLSEQAKQPYLSLLESEQCLVDRLKHSPVRLVRLDPDLGGTGLRLWADACKQANKAVFLWVPSAHALHKRKSLLRWRLKRLIDWSTAVLLLLTLSPVMLGLVVLMRIYLPGPIFFRQWCVGERGKLFQTLKFRTMANSEKLYSGAIADQRGLNELSHTSPLGLWIHKYSLDKLPQLFNVLRGEMSLVGPRAWALDEAIQLSLERRQQLNALPGITRAAWQ